MKHNVQESIMLKKAISRIRNCCHLLSLRIKKRLVAKFAVAFTRMMADIHPSKTHHLASLGTRILNFAYLFAFKFRRDTSLPAVV